MNKLNRCPASYEDLLQLPENLVGEIIHGVLHSHPRPAPKHALAYSSVLGELNSPFQKGKGGPGGWWILAEPECHILSHVLVPDLVGWRKEKMPIYAQAGVNHLWLIDPNIEVLESYELLNGKWLLLDTYEKNQTVKAKPFQEHEFELGVLWE